MKRNNPSYLSPGTIILPLMLLMLFSSALFAQWQLVNNMPPPLNIKSAAFASENHVMVFSESKKFITSTDKGISWEYFTPLTHVSANALHFFNPQYGIAAGDTTTYYTTNDSGKTWTSKRLSGFNHLNGIRVLNDSTWVLLTIPGNLFYRTTNAGLTWNTFLFPAILSDARRITFLDVNNIMMLSGTTVYRTSTGGSDWAGVSFAAGITPQVVHYPSAQNALIYTTDGRVFTSANGGLSWFFKSNCPVNITHSQFLSQTKGVLLTSSGYLYTTVNGAETFDSLRLPENTGAPLSFFVRPDNQFGFTTFNWKVYVSFNGGVDWFNHFSANRLRLNAVDCSYSNTTFTVVGDHGSIFSIQNLTATAIPSPTQQHLKAASITGPMRGLIVGDSGTVLYRPLGGTQWILSTNSFRVNLRATAYSQADVAGYAVGERGVILYSNSAGQHWVKKRDDIYPHNLNAILMKNKSNVIVVGDSGTVLRTTDEGATWLPINLGTDKNLSGISANGDNILIVGSDGVSFRSTNYGTTWYASPVQPGINFVAVSHYTNPSAGAATRSGKLLNTSNNGQSWHQETEFYNIELTSLSYYNFSIGAMTTKDGFILFRNSTVPVELVSFDAVEFGGKVLLQWKTASEINNLGFEIQKSENRVNWQTIGFVRGSGTTTETSEYSFMDIYPLYGKSCYRLVQKDFDGQSRIYGEKEIFLAGEFTLSQNYPNPFNPATQIEYTLPEDSDVEIKVYSSVGSEVIEVEKGFKTKGTHTLTIDGSRLASGIYYYTMRAGGRFITKKMAVIK